MLWIRRTVSQTVFNVKHSYFRDVRWIGISSTYAANWVFHCNQKGNKTDKLAEKMVVKSPHDLPH